MAEQFFETHLCCCNVHQKPHQIQTDTRKQRTTGIKMWKTDQLEVTISNYEYQNKQHVCHQHSIFNIATKSTSHYNLDISIWFGRMSCTQKTYNTVNKGVGSTQYYTVRDRGI